MKFGKSGGGTDFVEALTHFVPGKFSLPRKILECVSQIKRNVARRIIKDLSRSDHETVIDVAHFRPLFSAAVETNTTVLKRNIARVPGVDTCITCHESGFAGFLEYCGHGL